jgi:hypothetical protein
MAISWDAAAITVLPPSGTGFGRQPFPEVVDATIHG